jgi:hypothetical protein
MRLRSRAAGALCVVVLSACGGENATEDQTSTATSEAQPEPSETTQPTETAQPTDPGEVSEPTETAEPTEGTEPTDATEPPGTTESTGTPTPTDGPTSPAKGLFAALLTDETLPAPGDAVWESVRTKRGTGPADVSICQVVELHSLGTTRGVTSRFRSGSVRAVQVVAQFVDELGATQAYEVLEAWLGRCAGQARERGYDQADAPASYTEIDSGHAAGWALVTYGPVPDDPDAAYIETQSLVRVGDTLSWVVWEQIGQDYNYEPGQAPPERAIPLMTAALAGS